MDDKLTSTSRVWVSGGACVVTVPYNIRRILNIKKGDTVIVDWGEVIKLEDKNKTEDNDNEDGGDLPKL